VFVTYNFGKCEPIYKIPYNKILEETFLTHNSVGIFHYKKA